MALPVFVMLSPWFYYFRGPAAQVAGSLMYHLVATAWGMVPSPSKYPDVRVVSNQVSLRVEVLASDPSKAIMSAPDLSQSFQTIPLSGSAVSETTREFVAEEWEEVVDLEDPSTRDNARKDKGQYYLLKYLGRCV